MEDLVITMFADTYRGKRVLITGHTGFKGSWLSLWLTKLGAHVTGIGLPPETEPSHWSLLGLKAPSTILDIRKFERLQIEINRIEPEIIFHLAAQPLVRRSYSQPLETWSTNVMGTANVLEACRTCNSIKAIVVVTTDKCYANREIELGYREIDALGGHDPYSASKAGSELVAASYRSAFFSPTNGPLLATARAGNVIGGGDWSEDRLIPDLVRAVCTKTSLEIRSPNATRPWQHVLECLSGYLLLGQGLLEGRTHLAVAWNFGPDKEGNQTVSQVLKTAKDHWDQVEWFSGPKSALHEANLLHLDCTKAHRELTWKPVWTFGEGVKATMDWYKAWFHSNQTISVDQIESYCRTAAEHGLIWAQQQK
jgi:CDP-glucose 4,6-dehydratase